MIKKLLFICLFMNTSLLFAGGDFEVPIYLQEDKTFTELNLINELDRANYLHISLNDLRIIENEHTNIIEYSPFIIYEAAFTTVMLGEIVLGMIKSVNHIENDEDALNEFKNRNYESYILYTTYKRIFMSWYNSD